MSEKLARKARTAEQNESARQVAELAALRRMLIASEGTFSLSFAVYNVVRLRDELLKQLTGEFPGVVSVRLAPSTQDVLEEVRGRVCGAASGEPAAIFVIDLERLLPPETRADQILRSLNASRELWETFRCPVVFWLAEHAATMVAAKAVDFWRYRSHSFEFAAAPDIASFLSDERFPGYDMIVGMPYEEKRFRRAELERRIVDAGDPPSKKMLLHVLDWMYELAKLNEIFGDWKSAEAIKRRALSWAEREYGPESPEYALGLNNLALLLQATNRLEEAEPLLRRALVIDEQAYGAEHPEVAINLNNLAQLLKAKAEDAGRQHDWDSRATLLAEAESLGRWCFEILLKFTATSGHRHPQLQTAMDNYAALLQTLGQTNAEVRQKLNDLGSQYGVSLDRGD